MNEPHVQTASEWLGSANAAIAAIRGAGASQEILVPGTDWDGAWTWTTDRTMPPSSAPAFRTPRTILRSRFISISIADGSGTHAGVVSADDLASSA